MSKVIFKEELVDIRELGTLFRLSRNLAALSLIRSLVGKEIKRGTKYYIARVDNHPVGLIGVYYPDDKSIGETGAQVTDMAVIPEYQRRGIGSGMFNQIIEFAKKAGAGKIWGSVEFNHRGLFAFLKKCGFREEITIMDMYGRGGTLSVYQFEIQIPEP